MKKSLAYWIPTSLLLLLMVGSGIMYFVKSEEIAQIFIQLQYPVYSMYFNAVAKILGGIAIVVPIVPRVLKEWAYAGYLFIILLALQAVVMTMPGVPWVMFVSILIWALSYWQFKKR